MRRTERLFAIAEYLRGRRTGVTAGELAERFDVTIRTMYRDLDSLRAGSLPLNSERGRGGGYALDRAYSLPPVNFTAREAALLITAGKWLTQMRFMPFVDTLQSALEKVQGALSASSQRQLLDHMKTLEFIGVPARPVDAKVRRAIERAWFESLPLRIEYLATSFALSTRRIRVLGVIMERSETLLSCQDLDKNEERQFKLDRIQRAEVLALHEGGAR
jgi:predicted DNA-binding transcriptional regulator YafY